MKKKTHRTNQRVLFLLDWDDTLFATDHFQKNKASQVQDDFYGKFNKLISTICKMGEVFIVTNSDHGWIHLCVEKHASKLKSFLDDWYNRSQIISAKTRYSSLENNDPVSWKHDTFREILHALNRTCPGYHQWNIISVGDLDVEHKAADQLHYVDHSDQSEILCVQKVFCKRKPTEKDLLVELDLLQKLLPVLAKNICSSSNTIYLWNETQKKWLF
jgi:hypothetical protein